jgi:hypothetical protein
MPGIGLGTRTNEVPACSLATARWTMFSASRPKSSSASTSCAATGRTSRGLDIRACGLNLQIAADSTDITRRSSPNRARRPGRCTLTTTSVPSYSTASCTWAMLAAARGIGSNWANSSPIGLPSEASMTFAATPGGTGGTSSRHQANARTHSSGSRPSAVAMD